MLFSIDELPPDAAPRQDLAPIGQGVTWHVKSLKFSQVPSSLRALTDDETIHYVLLTANEPRLLANFRQRALRYWTLSVWARDFNEILKPRLPVMFSLSTTILLSSDSNSGSSSVGLVHQLPPTCSQVPSADAEEIFNCSRAFQLFVLLQTDGAVCCTLPQYLGAGRWHQPNLHSADMRFGEEDEGPSAIEAILAHGALCVPASIQGGSDVAGQEDRHSHSTSSGKSFVAKGFATQASSLSPNDGPAGLNLSNLPKRSSLLLQRHPSSAAMTRATYEVSFIHERDSLPFPVYHFSFPRFEAPCPYLAVN